VDNAQYDRGVKIKMQLDQMVNTLNNMDVGSSLVWLWTWDIIVDKYNSYKSTSEWNDVAVTEGVTLDYIWDKLWEFPPNQFTLEYGSEYMDDAIQDWMIENEFLVSLDDDGWLDDEEDDEDSDDVQSDNTTEYGTQEADFKAEPVELEGSTQ
jgi:hypothetical protein